MDGQGVHARFIQEGILDAIALMGIEINVKHTLNTKSEQCANGQCWLIEVAKSTGPVRPAVVLPAPNVEDGAASPGQTVRG